MPQHRGQLTPQLRQQQRIPLRLIHRGQPLSQRPRSRSRRGRKTHQPTQHRRQQPQPRLFTQRGHIQPRRNQHRLTPRTRQIKQLQTLLGRHRRQPHPPHPRQIGVSELASYPAGLLPQPPRQRHPRQPLPAPVARQRVQKRVARHIIGLPRAAQHRSSRRKQHKRRQPHLPGQLMQMPRTIDLGRQHLLHPRTIQRLNHPIRQHPSKMNDRAQPMLTTNAVHQPRQLLTIAHIAGHHLHPTPQPGQLRNQLLNPGRRRTTPTHQHHMPHPIPGRQMPGQRHPQHPSTPRDQHRRRRIKHRPRHRIPDLLAHLHQPRRQHHTVAHRQPRLTTLGHRRRHRRPRRRTAINIEQHKPARMLRRRAAQQPIHHRTRQIRRLTLRGGHRRLSHHHQPRTHQNRLTQPRLDQLQGVIQPPTNPTNTSSGDRHRGQHHLRCAAPRTNHGDQSPHIRITLHTLPDPTPLHRPTTIKNRHPRHRPPARAWHPHPIHPMQPIQPPRPHPTQRHSIHPPKLQRLHRHHRRPKLIHRPQPQCPTIGGTHRHPQRRNTPSM